MVACRHKGFNIINMHPGKNIELIIVKLSDYFIISLRLQIHYADNNESHAREVKEAS